MNKRFILILTGLSLLAGLVSLYTTSTGTGLNPDSYVYVASARSLLRGDGVLIPQGPDGSAYTAHFPPLYAAILALSSLGVFDAVEAARWLNALLFGASLFLVGLSVWRFSGGSSGMALLGGILFLGSAELLLIYAQVWSEAPFFFFMLLGLLLLSRSLPGPDPASSIRPAQAASPPPVSTQARPLALRLSFLHQERWLILSASAIALACLLRYAGVMCIASGGLALLLYARGSLGERIKRTCLFLAISAIPVGLWMIYNQLRAGSLTNRMLSLHLVDGRDFQVFLNTASAWLFPGAPGSPWLKALALAAVLAGLVLVGVYLLRTVRLSTDLTPPGQDLPAQPFALFTLAYVAFLLVSLSFIDAQTSLDARILSPVYITILILVLSALARGLPRSRKEIRLPALALLAAFTIAQLVSGARQAAGLRAGEDKGYTSAYWAGSRLLKQVADLPDTIPIYSNGADVIYLLTGKPAIGLPREISPNSLKVNERFEVEMLQVRQALEHDQAVLVVFYELEQRRRYLPSEWELNDMLPLKRVTRWKNEGALYRIAGEKE